jgi:hypothetical protein
MRTSGSGSRSRSGKVFFSTAGVKSLGGKLAMDRCSRA